MLYRVVFTRPYLSDERRCEVQREVIAARDEAQVHDIYADCEIIAVEDAEPPTVSEAVSVQYGESELQAQHDDWKDLRRTEEDARL